ncbi:MAG: hypothetical protein LBJ92_04325 [Holosporales bacterium]|jgi:hypothetical protein|nr:hypothetical protein [Holosporales bacterium]
MKKLTLTMLVVSSWAAQVEASHETAFPPVITRDNLIQGDAIQHLMGWIAAQPNFVESLKQPSRYLDQGWNYYENLTIRHVTDRFGRPQLIMPLIKHDSRRFQVTTQCKTDQVNELLTDFHEWIREIVTQRTQIENYYRIEVLTNSPVRTIPIGWAKPKKYKRGGELDIIKTDTNDFRVNTPLDAAFLAEEQVTGCAIGIKHNPQSTIQLFHAAAVGPSCPSIFLHEISHHLKARTTFSIIQSTQCEMRFNFSAIPGGDFELGAVLPTSWGQAATTKYRMADGCWPEFRQFNRIPLQRI